MKLGVAAAQRVARLARLRAEAGRADAPFEVTLGAELSGPDDLARWADAGVDRLVVAPWRRSAAWREGLGRCAEIASDVLAPA